MNIIKNFQIIRNNFLCLSSHEISMKFRGKLTRPSWFPPWSRRVLAGAVLRLQHRRWCQAFRMEPFPRIDFIGRVIESWFRRSRVGTSSWTLYRFTAGVTVWKQILAGQVRNRSESTMRVVMIDSYLFLLYILRDFVNVDLCVQKTNFLNHEGKSFLCYSYNVAFTLQIFLILN